MIDTSTFTPEQRDLLGRAADMINTNPYALSGFRSARRDVEVSSYRLPFYFEVLRDDLQSKLYNNIGWWYGRITDPRRKEKR